MQIFGQILYVILLRLHRPAVGPVHRGLGPGLRAPLGAARAPCWWCSRASTRSTDPPIKALRRVVPPLRIGQVALDLSFLIVVSVAAWLLLSVVATVFLPGARLDDRSGPLLPHGSLCR